MDQLQSWCNQMQMEISGVAFTHTKADTSLGHRAKGGKPQLSVVLPRNSYGEQEQATSSAFSSYLLSAP